MDSDLIFRLLNSKLKLNNNTAKEDFVKFTNIKKMINRYLVTGNINTNLILNAIITLNNRYESLSYDVFTLLLTEQQLSVLNPFYVFLGFVKYVNAMDYNVIIALKKFAAENYIKDHFLKEC